jgi:hypothetical protein
VYPLFQSLFKTHAADYSNYDDFLATQTPLELILRSQDERHFQADERLLAYLLSPWTTTMRTSRAAGKTGVVFLLCLPGMIWFARNDRRILSLLAFAAGSFALWIVFFPGDALRYIFAIFPPLSLVATYFLQSISCSRQIRVCVAGGLILIQGYHFLLFFQEMRMLNPLAYLLNNQSQEEFLTQHGVNYFPVVEYINEETPPDAKILFVPEIRGYYCERDRVIATNAPYDREEILLRRFIQESHAVEEVLRKLHDLGITHILLNLAEMRRFLGKDSPEDLFFAFETEKDRRLLRNLLSPRYVHLLMNQHEVMLFELLSSPQS